MAHWHNPYLLNNLDLKDHFRHPVALLKGTRQWRRRRCRQRSAARGISNSGKGEEGEGSERVRIAFSSDRRWHPKSERMICRYVKKCRKIHRLGCVNQGRTRARVTQPSPRIFLHICRYQLIHLKPDERMISDSALVIFGPVAPRPCWKTSGFLQLTDLA